MTTRPPCRVPSAQLLLASLLTTLAALPAAAQVQNFDVVPTSGLPLPITGAAAAEESTAMQVNPAGLGFVHGPAFQYFHVGRSDDAQGAGGDGFYLGGLLGPVGPGFSMEWVRPVGGPDYRITTLGLALSDGSSVSFGMDWRWWLSGDASLAAMHAFDFGVTFRPTRSLSIAGSAMGYGARLNGAAEPVRYDFGLGYRLPRDSVTLSADYLADDDGRGAFRSTGIAAGLGVELPSGFGLNAQVRFPLPDARPNQDGFIGVFGLTWNQAHGGATGGMAAGDQDARWMIGVRTSYERYPASSSPVAAAKVDLAHELEPHRILFIELGGPDPYDSLLRRLEAAREDGDVGALVLEVDDLPIGAGKVDELRASILATRKVKPVLAYLTGGATREYWLASAATRVAMVPSSTLMMNGMASSQLYLKDGLARLGVVVEVARAGGYKTAPEPLTHSEPSPESKEMTGSVLDDLFGRFTMQVAASRTMTPDRVKTLVDQGLFSANEARAAGLVDDLLWPDEVERWAREAAGLRLKLQDGYDPTPPRVARHWGQPPVIAIIPVEGAISGGMTRREPFGSGSLTGSASVVEQLDRAAANGQVKAIVLRVDSPGGDAVASDLIWRAVTRARAKKPVIASMGDLAASGGYLAAVGADTIVAEPSTLTGSIGVFVLKPDFSGLLAKLDIHRGSQVRGQVAEVTSLSKPWTPAERAAVEKQVDATYSNFLDRVTQGRHLPRAEVEKSAGGRVWTGQQALDRKLVDRLGGLAEALALARERAGLAPDAFVEYRRSGGHWYEARLSPAASLQAGSAAFTDRVLAAVPELRTAAVLLELGPVLALPEEWLGAGPSSR